MKPYITIDDQEIYIDGEHYTLTIRLKQVPVTKLSEEIKSSTEDIIGFPKEVLAAMDAAPPAPGKENTSNGKHWLKGKPAYVALSKICKHCKMEYKPTGNAQTYCSKECNIAANQAVEPKPEAEPPKVETKSKPNRTNAAIRDKRELHADKKLKAALKKSPNTDDLTPVRIDDKTTIYVEPGEDIEAARQNFINKHNQFENDN